jgi:hypothetical protein
LARAVTAGPWPLFDIAAIRRTRVTWINYLDLARMHPADATQENVFLV